VRERVRRLEGVDESDNSGGSFSKSFICDKCTESPDRPCMPCNQRGGQPNELVVHPQLKGAADRFFIRLGRTRTAIQLISAPGLLSRGWKITHHACRRL